MLRDNFKEEFEHDGLERAGGILEEEYREDGCTADLRFYVVLFLVICFLVNKIYIDQNDFLFV